jgi:hypothetical protein
VSWPVAADVVVSAAVVASAVAALVVVSASVVVSALAAVVAAAEAAGDALAPVVAAVEAAGAALAAVEAAGEAAGVPAPQAVINRAMRTISIVAKSRWVLVDILRISITTCLAIVCFHQR